MAKRSWYEKIFLIILFMIGSPFILGIYLFFVLLYLLIAPFERLIYKKSFYYQDLKEKYYLFVSFDLGYQKYNEIRKKGFFQEIIINEKNVKVCCYEKNCLIYAWFLEISLIDNKWMVEKEVDLASLIEKKDYLVINKKMINRDDYKLARSNANWIIYEKG